jgi:hypothetical protein
LNRGNHNFAEHLLRSGEVMREERAVEQEADIASRGAAASRARLWIEADRAFNGDAGDARFARAAHEINAGSDRRRKGATAMATAEPLDDEGNGVDPSTEVRRLAHIWHAEAANTANKLESVPCGANGPLIWAGARRAEHHHQIATSTSKSWHRLKCWRGVATCANDDEDRQAPLWIACAGKVECNLRNGRATNAHRIAR